MIAAALSAGQRAALRDSAYGPIYRRSHRHPDGHHINTLRSLARVGFLRPSDETWTNATAWARTDEGAKALRQDEALAW